MYKRLSSYYQFILASAVLSLTLVSCDKEVPHDSPAYYIAESEKLVIPATVTLPEDPHSNHKRVATYFAVGVQKYKAQLKAGASTYEWVLVGPQADLYDNRNAKVGTHGVGPHWQLSPKDSIFAQQFSPARTAPSPEPNTVDWLLLMPKAGTTPTGIFKHVLYIQRIATKGGKAPATLPASATEMVEVPYTAIYRFSK